MLTRPLYIYHVFNFTHINRHQRHTLHVIDPWKANKLISPYIEHLANKSHSRPKQTRKKKSGHRSVCIYNAYTYTVYIYIYIYGDKSSRQKFAALQRCMNNVAHIQHATIVLIRDNTLYTEG